MATMNAAERIDRGLAEMARTIDRLRYEARLLYHADGSHEVAGSQAEAIRRRIEAAREIERGRDTWERLAAVHRALGIDPGPPPWAQAGPAPDAADSRG